MKHVGTWWRCGLVGWMLAVSACGETASTPVPPPTPSICGNGIIEAPEQCDDDTIGYLACDRWCEFACGNGTVDDGEACDPAADAGCPDACDDGDPCTLDAVADVACQSTCLHTAANTESCCQSGSSAGTPACLSEHYVYRFTSFQLRDPHAFVELGDCTDITDVGPLAINRQYDKNIDADNDDDGMIDFSPVLVVAAAPSTATAGDVIDMHFNFANCLADGSLCGPSTLDVAAPSAVIATGSCLAIDDAALGDYVPQLARPAAPCLTSAPTTAAFQLGGIPLVLEQTQISATLVGDPAEGLINGVIRGFLSEATADATTIPASIPLVGGKKLSIMLPGGTPAGAKNCAAHDDRDTFDGQAGWWFHVNFTAVRVSWQPAP